jgi:hypothetical protein
MMSDLLGPRSIPSALAVPEEINHLKGKKRDLLVHPGGSVRLLYLECEDGEYRLRLGDILEVNMPSDAVPKTEITDGTGSLSLRAGQIRVMPAPDELTALGLSPKSVLTFYYI